MRGEGLGMCVDGCVSTHLKSVIDYSHGAIDFAFSFEMKLLNTRQIHDKVDGREHEAQLWWINRACTVFGDASRHKVGRVHCKSWLATHRCQVHIVCSDSELGPWRDTLLQTPL